MRRGGLIVYLLFLISGATALVYEVAWMRDLSLIFGASHQAVSIVLGSFMLGLALGGYWLGRRSIRMEDPLRVYGLLEIGIGGFAVVMPTLLRWADELYISAAERLQNAHGLLAFTRVGAAFGLLVLPTICMGGTLPVLTRFLVGRGEDLGKRLSTLYSINTLGAVLGVLGAGFVLLPRLGVWRTELAAAAANGVVGITAIALSRRARPHAVVSPDDDPREDLAFPPAATNRPLRRRDWLSGARPSADCARWGWK